MTTTVAIGPKAINPIGADVDVFIRAKLLNPNLSVVERFPDFDLIDAD
jgi:hypothetical protein